jgi:hypothetical protein
MDRRTKWPILYRIVAISYYHCTGFVCLSIKGCGTVR